MLISGVDVCDQQVEINRWRSTPAVGEATDVSNGHERDVWSRLGPLFCDDDDNPIPEMRLCDVPAGCAERIWDRLLRGAELADPEATVWLKRDDRDVLAREVDHLASLAEEHGIPAMHIVVSNVSANGTALPDLGVSISAGEVALDFRVNVWDERTATAFVSLLAELRAMAPGARVIAADEVGRPYDDATQAAVDWALDSRDLS
jgi:hypothetical protein